MINFCCMNRNVLKIIAILSMVVDHVGNYLLDNNIVLRVIGRIAFPIFAFFIAEGMRYTRSKKRYILTLLLFACISEVPYVFLKGAFKLNILFTFLLAILFILLIEKLMKVEISKSFAKMLLLMLSMLTLFVLCLIFGDVLGYIDYSTLGIIMVVVFYFAKSPLRLILAIGIIVLMVLKNIFLNEFAFEHIYQIFAILAIVLLFFYNNKKGKLNLKYAFYVFYPAHLFVIWILSLII